MHPDHPPTPDATSALHRSELTSEVGAYVDTLEAEFRQILASHGFPATADGLADAIRSGELPENTINRLRALFAEHKRARTENTLSPERSGEGIPYEQWRVELNPLLAESIRTGNSPELRTAFPNIENSPDPIEFLIQSQEAFYRTQYEDDAFTIDRAKLSLPRERLDAWKDALARGEADYPLVVAPPRTLKPEEQSDPNLTSQVSGLGSPPRTLHRVLFDRLIRGQKIKAWENRTNPTLDEFLDQVRDCTLEDLTRTDLLGPDGTPLRFEAIAGKPNAEQPWLAYLQALYPTLPRPDVTSATPSIGFVKWEGDPPADRAIPPLISEGQAGTTETIGNKSQLDAVRLRYPLATPSQWLVLFAQYHAKTGKPFDDLTKPNGTWSWLFAILDPTTAFDRPSVRARWGSDGLDLDRHHPGSRGASGRLRSSR